MLNNRTEIIEKLSSPPPPLKSSRFSYIIRPSTPCIFGRECYNDDDDEQMDDDEFFVTAGGIVHSCPNIYELSIDNHRKLQSCDHLMFIDPQTTFINQNLNCYETKSDRYSILPRFQPISSSISSDSMNSELELYKARHAIGLSRQYHDNTSPHSLSFLPTTWKSDNYLFFMPFLPHHSSLLNSIDHGKRSRSYDITNGQTYPFVVA
jgi:hypothetical protein